MNKKYSLLILLALLLPLGLQAQKAPQDMDRFLDNLLKRMTLEEKIGQLNLPVTGEITTGQAKSSDIAAKIKRGEVGGLFNLKGVDKIRDVQRLAVENSRLGIPLLFGMDVIHGYETIFPIPLGLSCTWDIPAIEESARIAAIEASADGISWTFSPNGRYQSRSTLGTGIRRFGRRSFPRSSDCPSHGTRISGKGYAP